MTTNQLLLNTGFPAPAVGTAPRPSVLDTWIGWTADRLAAVRLLQQRRRTIAELARMSDSRLRDLGIPRGQIAEIVDGRIARQGPSMWRQTD